MTFIEEKAFEAGRVLALSGLLGDLTKLKWIGSDEGWERAIAAVREEISNRINANPTRDQMIDEASAVVRLFKAAP